MATEARIALVMLTRELTVAPARKVEPRAAAGRDAFCRRKCRGRCIRARIRGGACGRHEAAAAPSTAPQRTRAPEHTHTNTHGKERHSNSGAGGRKPAGGQSAGGVAGGDAKGSPERAKHPSVRIQIAAITPLQPPGPTPPSRQLQPPMLPEATGPLRQQQPQDLARDASASSDISTAASLTSMASSACDNACRSADVSPCESPSNANITYLPYCPTADLPAKAESRLIHSAPLSHESKARIAVVQAFAESPAKMMGTYCVKRIIGFGSNGVVLAASFKKSPVAIKIIYKAQAAVTHTGLAAEVEAAKYLASSSSESSSHLLKYVDDWKDARHFYLVTELFGSDWLASSPTEKLCPLNFKAIYANAVATICLPFHSGSSDLWAWAYAHRALVWESTQHRHTFLPINPIKRLIRQIAVALAQIHVRGFYHGDVKIENVLVQAGHSGTPRGGDDLPQVRLADYGHANHVSCGMKVYGTREVSPPEFLRGSPYSWNDGRAADIFALGMVMYKLLHESGELPRIVQVAKSGVISYDALLKEDSGFLPLDGLRDVDEVAISLLDGMCMVDPARRLTVQHVLAHPWFSE